jgi:hypothetical protein
MTESSPDAVAAHALIQAAEALREAGFWDDDANDLAAAIRTMNRWWERKLAHVSAERDAALVATAHTISASSDANLPVDAAYILMQAARELLGGGLASDTEEDVVSALRALRRPPITSSANGSAPSPTRA